MRRRMLWNSFVFTSVPHSPHTIQHVPDVIHHNWQLTRLNCNTTGPWTTTWNSCVSFIAVSNAFDQIQSSCTDDGVEQLCFIRCSLQHPSSRLAHEKEDAVERFCFHLTHLPPNQHVVTQQRHLTTHAYKRPHRTELVTVLATSCDKPHTVTFQDRMESSCWWPALRAATIPYRTRSTVIWCHIIGWHESSCDNDYRMESSLRKTIPKPKQELLTCLIQRLRSYITWPCLQLHTET